MRTRKRTRKVSEMAEMLSLEDGVLAVRSARAIAEAETEDRICDVDFPETFRCDRGVFVTISEYPSGILRGCIGYLQPSRFPWRQGGHATTPASRGCVPTRPRGARSR